MQAQTVADIMTREVISCVESDSLKLVNGLMTQHNIRHLPVLDSSSGNFLGLLSQKHLLREAFYLAKSSGEVDLANFGNQIRVEEVYSSGVVTATPNTPLEEAGRFFLNSKHGCLPVLEQERLVGMVTSVDFVRLCVDLLKERNRPAAS
ncbi:CBS domain-containing protein [Aestuariirhabdus litorea]|uniref:CBS domain-containing protein n=1 Tax=Aestuariirhabdus litorea TaxID=2528527 RepID=A0A3P3VKD2_9GAMM|nr:CBS domain-containing protein [Aestuariirhabdus litorea]RRJ82229.1 CBS domain-containing protein [Aestuariirhabdus litorea]RWW91931.1 CBS domain-containing protein [Endozoicomonadaceae bacterium GTF-13]